MTNSHTPTPTHSHTPSPVTYTSFAPLLLTLIGLVVLLSWNLFATIQQTSNLQTLKFQVWQATLQSTQAEEKLQAMLSDVIDLAAKDADAAAIVKRYNIKQNLPKNLPLALDPKAGIAPSAIDRLIVPEARKRATDEKAKDE